MTMDRSSHVKPRTFGELLLKSFWSSYGHIMALLGLAVGMIALFVVPKDVQLSLRSMVLPILAAVYLVIWFAYAAWVAYNATTVIAPAAVGARATPSIFPDAVALLLMEPSEVYSHDAFVCVYYLEEDFERLIGLGKVFNIQDDKIIQVLVTRDLDFGDGWTAILANDARALRKIRIKPNVPFTVLENYYG